MQRFDPSKQWVRIGRYWVRLSDKLRIPVAQGGGAPAFDQYAFRLRNDDGSITAATYMGTGNNQNQTIDVDTPFRIRFLLDEYNDKLATITPNLYVNYNGGGWEDIATCPEVDWATSAYVSDGTAVTTNDLGSAPSGSFENGEYDQNGTATAWSMTTKNDYTEYEFCITIDSTQVTDGQTFQLRVYNGTSALDLYSNTPTITVNVPPADVNVYPAARAAGADSVGPTVRLGSVSITPAAVPAGADSVDPTVNLSQPDINVTPSAVTGAASSSIGEARQGDLSYTPTLADAGSASLLGDILQSSVNVSPTLVSAGAASAGPTTQLGSVSITPTASVSSADSVFWYMHTGEVYRLDFEEGDLSDFDTGTQGAATSAAANKGNYGWALTLDGTIRYNGMRDANIPTNVINIRFYFNPNAVQNTVINDGYVLLAPQSSISGQYIGYVDGIIHTDGSYHVQGSIRADGGATSYTAQYDLTREWHLIEIQWKRSTSATASDGEMSFWLDGVFKETVSGIDNYDYFANYDDTNIGAWGIDANTVGTEYYDDIILRSDGQYIGSGPIDITPTPAQAGADSIPPTTEQGDLNVTPGVASAVATGVDPTVTPAGGVDVYPAAATASADSVFHYIHTGLVGYAGFEGQTFGEFDWWTDTDADASITTDAALVGSYGLEFLIDDTNAMFGGWGLAGLPTDMLSFRLYFDPRDIAQSTATALLVLVYVQDSTPENFVYLLIDVEYPSGDVKVYGEIVPDGGAGNQTSKYIISERTCIEVKIARATSQTASDGYMSFWLNGVLKETVSGVDNWDRFENIQNINVGIMSVDAGTSGTPYMDDIIFRSDGAYIGTADEDIIPSPATASAVGVGPSVELGDISVTPSPASARTIRHVLDDFNRASLGSDWLVVSPEVSTIVANELVCYAGSKVYRVGETFSNDQYIEATVRSTNGWAGLSLRNTGTDDVVDHANYIVWWYTSSPYNIRIGHQFNNGGWGQYLDASAYYQIVEGDRIRFEVSGQDTDIELRFYVNGVLRHSLTYAQMTIKIIHNTGAPGFYGNAQSDFDDFEGGSITSVSVSQGSINITPSAATATATGVDPSVTPLVGLNIYPASIAAGADSVGPSVELGDLSVSPVSAASGTDSILSYATRGEIAYIDFEEGDLTDFTSVNDIDGDMVANGASAIIGSYGIELTIDDTNSMYGTKESYADSGLLGIRFYIDPHSMTMGNGDEFALAWGQATTNAFIFYMWFGYSSGNYTIRLGIVDDIPSTHYLSTYTIPDEPSRIEILLKRASTDASADGEISLWLNDVFKQTVGSIDNYDRFSDFGSIDIGALNNIDYPTTYGSFFIDAIVIRDDGQYIGSGPVNITPSAATASADSINPLVVTRFPFIDGFETGDTRAWTGENNSPTINGTAALVGSYGMEISYGQANTYSYLSWTNTTHQVYRVKFKFDTNDIDAGSTNFYPCIIYDGAKYAGLVQIYGNGTANQLRAIMQHDDDTYSYGSPMTLTPATEYEIEVEFVFADNTGYCRVWLNGVRQPTRELSNQDTGTRFPDNVRFGSAFNNTKTSGSVYLDGFVISDKVKTIDITPSAATATATGVDPTVTPSVGDIDVYPAALSAGADSVGPSVLLSSINVSPTSSSASAASVFWYITTGEVFHVTFEGGNLNEFDTITDPDNDLSATTAAAMVGNYGMSVIYDGAGSAYGRLTNLNILSNVISVRMYFDPNDLVNVGAGDTIGIMDFLASDNDTIGHIMMYSEPGTTYVRFSLYGDVATYYTSTYVITGPTCIEVKFTRATTPTSSDGYATLWLDGVFKETISNADNYDQFEDLSYVQIGAYGVDSGNITGTAFTDDIILRDDGQYIGTASFDITPSAASASADSVSPAVQLGSVGITPTPASSSAVSVRNYITQGQIFYGDLEEGDWSDFYWHSDHADFQVNTNSALVGDYGIERTCGASTNLYALTRQSSIISYPKEMSVRCYIDPNDAYVTSGVGGGTIVGMQNGAAYFASISIKGNTSNERYVRGEIIPDSGINEVSLEYLLTQRTCVEIKVVRATTPTSADGYLTIWIDGVLFDTVTGVDNYDRMYRYSYSTFGAWGMDTVNWTTGSIYVDDLVIRDDGQYIGTADENITPVSASTSADSAGPVVDISSGDVNVYPSLVSAGSDALGPSVVLGSISISSTAAAGADSVGPQVEAGNDVNVYPAASTAAADSVGPSIGFSSVSVYPSLVSAGADSAGPTVLQGDLSITPSVASGTATSVFNHMSFGLLYYVDHEEGDWTDYDGHSGSGIAVNTASALIGNYGLERFLDTGVDNAYGSLNNGGKLLYPTQVSARFYIDPHDAASTAYDQSSTLAIRNNIAQYWARVMMEINVGGDVNIRGFVTEDSGSSVWTAWYTITQRTCVEIKVVRSSSSTASDGYITLWIDGVFKETVSNIDCYDRWSNIGNITFAGWGHTAVNTSGSYYLDDLVVRDDGQYIGTADEDIIPVPASAATDTAGPSVIFGDADVTPAPAASSAATVNPTVEITGGGEWLYPSAATAGADASILTIQLGNVSITLYAVTSVTESFLAETRIGSIAISTTPLSASAVSIDPTVEIVNNSVWVYPSPAIAITGTAGPQIGLSSMSVYPSTGSAGTSIFGPLVSITGGNFVAVSWARIRIPAKGISIQPFPATSRTSTSGNLKIDLKIQNALVSVTSTNITLVQVFVLGVDDSLISVSSTSITLLQHHFIGVQNGLIVVSSTDIQLGSPLLIPIEITGQVNSGLGFDLEVNSGVVITGKVNTKVIVVCEVNSGVILDLEIEEMVNEV